MSDSPQQAERQFQAFIAQVLVTRVIWVLRNSTGWAHTQDEGESTFLVWSERSEAARCAQLHFPDHSPEPMPLQAFIADVLPRLRKAQSWIGVNFGDSLGGISLPPDQFVQELPHQES